MLAWYKNSSPREKKTFWACYAGWALDSYDMQMFSFLLPTFSATFGCTWRLVGRDSQRPLWSSAYPGVHRLLVHILRRRRRVCAKLRAIADCSNIAGPRLWRRVGSRRFADGSGHQPEEPW